MNALDQALSILRNAQSKALLETANAIATTPRPCFHCESNLYCTKYGVAH